MSNRLIAAIVIFLGVSVIGVFGVVWGIRHFQDEVVLTIFGESHEEIKTVSCKRLDFCLTCLPGMDGKMDCSFKLSPYCEGKQWARFRYIPVEFRYRSGKIEKGEETRIVETGECVK